MGDSNDETNSPHKLLITNRQDSKLRKAFVNNSSANTKLLKTQLSEIVLLRRFLGRFLGLLMKVGLLLIKMYLNH